MCLFTSSVVIYFSSMCTFTSGILTMNPEVNHSCEIFLHVFPKTSLLPSVSHRKWRQSPLNTHTPHCLCPGVVTSLLVFTAHSSADGAEARHVLLWLLSLHAGRSADCQGHRSTAQTHNKNHELGPCSCSPHIREAKPPIQH